MSPVIETWLELTDSLDIPEIEYVKASAAAGRYLAAQCPPIDLSSLARKDER